MFCSSVGQHRPERPCASKALSNFFGIGNCLFLGKPWPGEGIPTGITNQQSGRGSEYDGLPNVRHQAPGSVLTRVDIVRAIGQVSTIEADVVLRTKARLGDREPEVIGQCLLTIVERERVEALPFVETFLTDPELRIDAAMAIAAQRSPESLAILSDAWRRYNEREILLAIGTLRTPEAVAWLLPMLETERGVRAALEPCRHFPGVEDALA